jgi:hypothetical protein
MNSSVEQRLQARERIASWCVCCGSPNLLRSPAVLMPFVAHRVFNWAPVTIDESWGLQTIPSGKAYSVCNTLYCEACGFVFLDIRFSEAELSRLYAQYRGEDYTSLRDHYEPGYRIRNIGLNTGIKYISEIEEFLMPHIKLPVKMLDWGGDVGKNTPFKGCNEVFDIYDISDKVPIAGARYVSTSQARSGHYDLIICSNVLEHVPYPGDLLDDMRDCMDPRTILYLEVPLEDCMMNPFEGFYRKKRHWHEHINFFSEIALRKLVAGCGLSIVGYNVLHVISEGRSCHLFQLACKLDVGVPSP